MALSSRTLGFAAVFLAGGGVGAAGVHAMLGSPSERSAEVADGPRQPLEPQGRDVPLEGAAEDEGRLQVDREVLRAALAELLEEDARLAPHDVVEEPDPAEGISAADALTRLETAYRAQLEAREGERHLLPAEVTIAEGTTSEEEMELDLPEPAEAPLGEALAAAEIEGPEELDDVERGPRLARVERAAAPPGLSTGSPTGPSTEPSTNMQIEGVQVHNGDVHLVDARQTHSNQVSIINQYQAVFVQPWLSPAGGQRGGGARAPAPSQVSPLSKPLESAHDQSPWSPVDYSRHHNPWGSTFGRRIP